MKTCTMYYLNRFGSVVMIRENVTEAERIKLMNDQQWITAYWTYWEKN